MCKEFPVIPEQGGGPKKNNQKKWRVKEEERHKGVADPPPQKKKPLCIFFNSLKSFGIGIDAYGSGREEFRTYLHR
jgi:hypothetical protein